MGQPSCRLHLPALCMAALLLAIPAATAGTSRPRVTAYVESLCPYCKAFVLQQLHYMFTSGIAELADVKLVPWGNTKLNTSDGGWVCQHGPLECVYDTLLSCAIHYHPDPAEWFPYTECIFRSTREPEGQHVHRLHQTCAHEAGWDGTPVWDCAQGDEGYNLQMNDRKATDALVPRHLGVPWVTVGSHEPSCAQQDIPLYDAAEFAPTIVCAAYAGATRLPAACYQEPPSPSMMLGRTSRSPLEQQQQTHASQAAA